MDPNQTPPPAYPGGSPPQTPFPAQPGYGQSVPQPQQPVNYPPTFAPQPVPVQPTYTQQPQPAPSPWYTPAPKPEDSKPSDVNSYLQAAGTGQQPQNPTGAAPGQMINGQYSIDYLDQMAAPTKQGIDKKFIFAGIGTAIALLVAGFLIFSTPKTTSVANEVKLYTTLISVEQATTKSGRLIKSSKLVAINSNLRTTLNNAARDMDAPLTNMGQNPTSLKTAARTGAYKDEKLPAALEDARLNSVYDRVYANEINAKVKYVIAYMESIKKSNQRKSMQEFISKNEPSFQTIQKSIDEYQKSEDANLN